MKKKIIFTTMALAAMSALFYFLRRKEKMLQTIDLDERKTIKDLEEAVNTDTQYQRKCDFCKDILVDKTKFPCCECKVNKNFKDHFKPHPVYVSLMESQKPHVKEV